MQVSALGIVVMQAARTDDISVSKSIIERQILSDPTTTRDEKSSRGPRSAGSMMTNLCLNLDEYLIGLKLR